MMPPEFTDDCGRNCDSTVWLGVAALCVVSMLGSTTSFAEDPLPVGRERIGIGEQPPHVLRQPFPPNGVPPVHPSETGFGPPTDTLFVVDVSASMIGSPIARARDALLVALDRMRPDDRFNLLEFHDDSDPLWPELRRAEPQALAQARARVRRLAPGGGTSVYPALMRGVSLMDRSRSMHARQIVLVTDGALAHEAELLRGLAERLGEIRLHAIAIGHAPNAHLLRKMTDVGHGLCEFVSSAAETEPHIDTVFARLSRPRMLDEIPAFESRSAHGHRALDLHAAQRPVLAVRLAGEPPPRANGAPSPARFAAEVRRRVTGRPWRQRLGAILAAVGLGTLAWLGLLRAREID